MEITKETIQKKISNLDYQYYFSFRIKEGGDIFEKRLYYFPDLNALFHDKNEKHFFMGVDDPIEREDECLVIPEGIVPIYLDALSYTEESKRATVEGFTLPAIDCLLESFWSENSENLLEGEDEVLKNFNVKNFLDILEHTKHNQPFYLK